VDGGGVSDRDLAALALGQLNYGVTLREITTAYTVFADGGVYHPWRSYFRVLDGDGNILLSRADRGEVVLSEENATVMTKLMQGVISQGTSSSIRLSKITECAGKTGTSNDDADRWFIGYTPELICGVWCGYEYPKPLEGKNICTRIWDQVMTSLVEQKGGQTLFESSPHVIKATYCKDSGKLMGEACLCDPRGAREESGWFVRGTVPTETCDCHILCDYDVDVGGISHGNCPADSLEQVGLIRVKRSFPMTVYVRDAQYVWDGDPYSLSPNPDSSKAYFGAKNHGYSGISGVAVPYHRSCPVHLHPPEEGGDEWEYLRQKLIGSGDE